MSTPPPLPPHPADWAADELSADEWVRELEPAEIEELDAALEHEGFPLPLLGPRLRELGDFLETGRGLFRLRGLPVERWGPERSARAFEGLAAWIGTAVPQSAEGERLLHVRDAGYPEGDPRVRGPLSRRRLSFHTDRCDVIAFLCIQPAESGGENHVLSSMRLYRKLREDHPAELALLMEPFVHQRHTVDLGNRRTHCAQPIFSFHRGHFAASFLRVLIDRADRDPKLPDLTPEARRALDLLEEVAEDPRLYVSFRQEAGDLLLLDNWVTFHRRTAFVDGAQPRHLMRLWLSVPNSRPLDPRFADNFGDTRAGALRGGMRPDR